MKYFDEEDSIAEYEKQLQKKDREIERLNNLYELMEQALEDKADEIERLHSIIKEVREKINKAIINSEIVGNETLNLSELLEILDKGE